MPASKNTRIHLVGALFPNIPEELVQEALKRILHMERAQFAVNLDTARMLWRKHRELVEAPEFPEPLRTAFIEEYDYEPGADCGFGEEVLDPDYPEKALLHALLEAGAGKPAADVTRASQNAITG